MMPRPAAAMMRCVPLMREAHIMRRSLASCPQGASCSAAAEHIIRRVSLRTLGGWAAFSFRSGERVHILPRLKKRPIRPGRFLVLAFDGGRYLCRASSLRGEVFMPFAGGKRRNLMPRVFAPRRSFYAARRETRLCFQCFLQQSIDSTHFVCYPFFRKTRR